MMTCDEPLLTIDLIITQWLGNMLATASAGHIQ